MTPLLQLFEFSYPDGFMFYDRSGALTRRLYEVVPDLTLKSNALDQRDFASATGDLELFFGIAVSLIRTSAPGEHEFPSTAARFFQAVTEFLEIAHLRDFRFRYVLGKLCNSPKEANDLMWPLVPEDSKAKMNTLAEPVQWQAIQGEFVHGNLAVQSRVAIVYLIPHVKLAPAEAKHGERLPHFTVQLEVRGLTPIDVAKFDAETFLRNTRDGHMKEIIAKLAPHLA